MIITKINVGWYKYTVGENNWRDIDELKEELSKGKIRVRKWT